MMQCPTTGAVIPTGITTDQRAFEKAQNPHRQVSCPACGGTHICDRSNAWVSGAGR